jgi:predicted AAA+ superfamily ATPase
MSKLTPNTAVELSSLLTRAESLLARLEACLPPLATPPDWSSHTAFRWQYRAGRGEIVPISHPQLVDVNRLSGVDEQKASILRNTAQYVAGHPANNVLLTGARGTGKSSLVKAMLSQFSRQGLRLIEVDKTRLADLAEITEQLAERTERFIIFCDDISFNHDDNGYLAMKVALDGTLAAAPDNVLIYATSNRRHLMPESLRDNLSETGPEIHPNETVEEKTSLSDRFGLWLSFYAFDQDTYLACVMQWLDALHIPITDTSQLRHEALQWALTRGARSGRSAWQFARDFAGRYACKSLL